jgi:hypothetical protein
LERHHLGFLGLQPFEIPQNGQRNVWKSLDRNTLDLEKLAKKLGARLCFAAFAPARRAGLAERGMAPVAKRRIAAIRSSMSPNDRNKIMHRAISCARAEIGSKSSCLGSYEVSTNTLKFA